MKLGLSLGSFTADPAKAFAAARRAAGAGYHAVFASDHVFPPGGPGRPALEPFTLLAAAAASNPGLGVGVLVTRPGMRPPGILAKEAAALDHVSGGRAILGLGLGDSNGRAEHRALGIGYPPIEDRAVVLTETAQALRALFSGEGWAGGRVLGLLAGPLVPPGSPEVWIGGASDRALEAAATSADAWNGWGLAPDAFAERASALDRFAEAAGRDPRDVGKTWAGIVLVGEDRAELACLEEERAAKGAPMDVWRGTRGELAGFAGELAAHGCTWMICLAAGPSDRLELIADTLRAA